LLVTAVGRYDESGDGDSGGDNGDGGGDNGDGGGGMR
jgi:hypothetical protein